MKDRVKAHLLQAQNLALAGEREKALDAVKKALAIDPGEMIITEVLLSMERSLNNKTENINSELPEISVQQPARERNNTANMDSKLEKIFKLSGEAMESGNDSKALAYLKKAALLFPDEPEVFAKTEQLKLSIRAANLVKTGFEKLSEGDVKRAVSSSRKAFDLQPDVKGLDELLSRIEAATDSIGGSEIKESPQKEVPTGAIAQASTDQGALLWTDRIRAAIKEDRFEEAGQMIAEAVKKHPQDALLDSFHAKLKRLGFVN
jgi:tetratricopeptide (TPR) repeat protein